MSKLNIYISLVQLKGTDPYIQHQAIWSLFPNVSKSKREHLFRIELKKGNNCVALLQSATQPQSSKQAKVLQSKPFSLSLKNDTSYKFKLVANPTKRCIKTKKILDIVNRSDQITWIKKKLSGAKVNVSSISDYLVSSKKCKCSRYVTYEGILQITDNKQIENAVITGIGRKKHAGAGLLSLARK